MRLLHVQVRLRPVAGSGAQAPPNRQTGMPRRFALSARLPVMPEPGNTMTPKFNVTPAELRARFCI